MASNKVALIIMDGWGLSPEEHGNAPLMAKTPTLDFIYANYPKTSLSASGLEVGLGRGEPGNSEVGHLNIGSGRVVWENLPRIDQAIESKVLAKNEILGQVLDKSKDHKLHFIGLISDGGVHSHIRHLEALLKIAKEHKAGEIIVHFISDGRDTAPKAAEQFADHIEKSLKEVKGSRVATLIGRYFAMDRDKNLDREKKAYDLMTQNTGTAYPSLKEAIAGNYDHDKSDEFIEPSVIGEGGKVEPGDTVIFFNFRNDRMRQMLEMFEKDPALNSLSIATMVQYNKDQKAPSIFETLNLNNTLSEIVALKGMSQFHSAETEKFAHVTYFFKGGKEAILKDEIDQIVPSKKVASYDKAPEMSAAEIADVTVKMIEKDPEFIVINFANGDMVGHTGNLEAAIKACEEVDRELTRVLTTASAHGYKAFITADHGNCEVMIDELTKKPKKEHTVNPVPFVFLDFTKTPLALQAIDYSIDDYAQYAIGTPIGVLADIAPSILANLGIDKPEDMSGMDLSVAML